MALHSRAADEAAGGPVHPLTSEQSYHESVKHIVKQGEHLTRLAEMFGFRDPDTIWNDGANASLKKQRDPNVLFPGDVIEIPDMEQRVEPGVSGRYHKFVVPSKTLRLHLRLHDENHEPLANTECELHIDGEVRKLTTKGDGSIDEVIPFLAEEGQLVVQDESYRVAIGHLDPLEEESGVMARLINLGYYLGHSSAVDEYQLRSAIEEFQCDHGLTVDGKCGASTRAKLKAVHGS